MKLNVIVLFALVFLIALTSARPAEEEYAEYEDEPAPPPKKTPARSSLIGRRNPLAARNAKTTSTTTATPPAEEEEEEVVDEAEGEEKQEQTSSTTEAPKKFLKGGIVRPFRSNDELLATLKRRREQAASNKHSKVNHASEAEESAPAPVHNEPVSKPSRASAGRRRFNSAKNNEPTAEEQPSSTAAPARTGRRFSSRS
ncbi:uncharacterized protein LOC123012526 [Tribolium madens]|uniref:uncharacterized protein LOC123012526 n=1 Tax=Tribolium madens TaxID=41895 RepID=UPI001CF75FC1|nr:uncharacterized protein LOC123012526 [Tribolium madens]